MSLVLSNKGKGMQSSSEQPLVGEERYVTTRITAAKETRPEANQLAIYKCSWEVEPGTTRIKFNEWSEWVLNPGSPDLKASTLTTGSHCLLT